MQFFWHAYFVIDAHAHLHVRIDCEGKGVHASFGGGEDTWGTKQTTGNHIRLESTALEGNSVVVLTQGWVVSRGFVKSRDAVRDGHVGIKRTKATFLSSGDERCGRRVHFGFEGNFGSS